jgi:hypothetical protein
MRDERAHLHGSGAGAANLAAPIHIRSREIGYR